MVQRSNVRYIHIAPAPGNVQPVSVANILITPPGSPTATLTAGKTLQLVASVTDFFRHPLSSSGLLWSSSSPSVATVDANGLVTGVAIGTTTITASIGAVFATLTAVVTQAQDGSIADLRYVIGDANIVALWDYATNVTTDGAGHATQVDDARGVGLAPPLLGNGAPKPTYDAVTGKITTDGSQNWMAAAIDPRWGLANVRTRAVAYIGDCTAADFPFGISVNGGGPAPYLLLQDNGTFCDLAVSPGASPSTIEGTQSSSFMEPVGAAIKLWIIEQHAQEGGSGTLTPSATAYQVGGRLRHVNCTASGNPGVTASVNSTVSVGNTPPQNPDFSHTNSYGLLVLSCVPTAAMRQAIQRWAVRRAGASVLDVAKNGILCVGDSITNGVGATGGQSNSYPAQLQTSLATYEVANRGVPSRTVAEFMTGSVWAHQALADRDSTQRAKDWLVFLAGTNDVQAGTTATILLPQYQSLCDQGIAAGYRVLVLTCLKRSSFSGAQETERQTFNAGVLTFVANGHATAVYDVASEVHFQNPADTTYFADGTHPTNAGYTIIAAGVAAAIAAAGG